MAARLQSQRHLVRRAVLLCILTTTLVATTEIIVGLTFDLISLVAEGIHTAVDLLDSILALILISIASRPPDEDHPYGHGKFDSMAGVIEGLAVSGSGIWALFTASRVLLGYTHVEPRPGAVAMIAMGAASLLYLGVSRYVLKLGQRTGSPTARAEGVHLVTHVYITGGLMLGVVLSWFAQRQGWAHAAMIDPVITVILGVGLVTLGTRVVLQGYRQMLDTALPTDERDAINRCLDEFRNEFIEVHSIRTRQAGVERHVDVHLVVTGETPVRDAHDLAHRIEDRVQECVPDLHFLVHIEPAANEELRRHADRGHDGIVIDDPIEPGSDGDPKHDEDDAARHR